MTWNRSKIITEEEKYISHNNIKYISCSCLIEIGLKLDEWIVKIYCKFILIKVFLITHRR